MEYSNVKVAEILFDWAEECGIETLNYNLKGTKVTIYYRPWISYW